MKVLHFLKKFSGFLLKKCFVSMSYWNEWVIGLNIWKKNTFEPSWGTTIRI